MKNCPVLSWVYVTCVLTMITGRSLEAQRDNNDISLDLDQLERLGQTDSLIDTLKEIAQSSHDCGIKEVPKLRRTFLTNSSITCNDGSTAGYYMRKSYGSTKWTLFLEGGWYCTDHVSCRMRWANNMKKYMSSKGWPETKRVSGILSWNPEENPYYFHSNMVYIPYCSSDSWSGTAAAGSTGNEFAFMGSLILEQVVRDLIPKGLKHASKLILTGSSAGGTGVLINLDRVADLMSELAPTVEVRGIADSGWFLDSPRYRHKDCIEASCAPMDVTKRGIKLWRGRVPETCKAQYPEAEHWRCYFGYMMYPSLKTPVYIIQYLFDEAQILVDNVFEQAQLRGENSASLVSKSQWEYLHKLGQEVRKTLENVSAVFAPACLSHELLMRTDWHNATVNNVKLGQSIYCWENSYGPDKCPLTNKKNQNLIKTIDDKPQRDSPKLRDALSDRLKRRRKKNKRRRRKCKEGSKSKKCKKGRKREKRRKKKERKKRRGRTRRHHAGNCSHHLIDPCPLPQCNSSCPKYRNRYTGVEMDFFKLFIRFGLDKKEVAELLGRDVASVEAMDDSAISRLIWDLVGNKN